MKGLLLALLLLLVFLYVIKRIFKSLRNPKRIVSETNGRKKISTNPSWFGGGWRSEYYFENSTLYEVHKGITAEIPFTHITQIKPGYTKINNRRNWIVHYRQHGVEKQVQFYPNLTLFNHNFSAFLTSVKEENPEAEIREISFFST